MYPSGFSYTYFYMHLKMSFQFNIVQYTTLYTYEVHLDPRAELINKVDLDFIIVSLRMRSHA